MNKQVADQQKRLKDEVEFRNVFHLHALGQGSKEAQVGLTQSQPSNKEEHSNSIPVRKTAADLPQTNATFDLLQSNLTNIAPSRKPSGESNRFFEDLQNTLLQNQQGSFDISNQRMNRQRFQGKLIFEWMNLNVSE